MNDVVLYTASIHEIDELEVFTRAHLAWFGTKNERIVKDEDRVYFQPGNSDAIPFWVRDYCRKEIAKFLEKEESSDCFGLFVRACIAKARRILTIGNTS